MICRLKLFRERSDNREKKKRRETALEDVESRRGYGRAFLLGLPGSGLSALAGTYAGSRRADELDRQGKSDKEILRGAGNRAALVGGGLGAGLAGGIAAIGATKGKLSIGEASKRIGHAAMVGGAFGGLGSYFGARKNTRERLNKRILDDYRFEKRLRDRYRD